MNTTNQETYEETEMSHEAYEAHEAAYADDHEAQTAESVETAETAEYDVELPDMSYAQLEQLKEAAIAKQREQREKERDADVNTIKVLVARHGLKWRDIKPTKAATSKVAPKYRNPETGDTWTGRGRAPLWIRDFSAEEREQFLI